MGRRPKVHLDTAASGAGEDKGKDKDEDDSFDEHMVGQWMRWRASYPVRGTGGVILADSAQPSASEQKAWHHYVQRNENGRVKREWWMPPFLVPFATVSWVPGGTGDEILKQCSVGPASGGRPARQHYTDVHRISCLARCHPQVVFVEPLRLNAWAPERDKVGRAKKFHHSPYDPHLVLGSGAAIIVACSVHNAKKDLPALHVSHSTHSRAC